MSIKTIIEKINKGAVEFGHGLPKAATAVEINKLKNEFLSNFQFTLPDIYTQILSFSNGILYNGLTVWPTHKYWLFRESIIEANKNLRDTFNDQFIYFGIRDEELYIYNVPEQKFQAIEFVGQPVWTQFSDADEMMKFMLQRALD
jgi:hypothetical protein